MCARTLGSVRWLQLSSRGGEAQRVGGLTRYDVDDLEVEITRNRQTLAPPAS